MKNREIIKELDILDKKITELRWNVEYHEPKLIWTKLEIKKAFDKKSRLEKMLVDNIKQSIGGGHD